MRENTTRIFSAEPVLYNHSDTKIFPRAGFPLMVPLETRDRADVRVSSSRFVLFSKGNALGTKLTCAHLF